MKVIAVSGTPGTGKTILSKKLAKNLNYYYLDVNKLISEYKLSEGYDKKRKTKIVNVKKLNKKLIDIINFFKKYNINENASEMASESPCEPRMSLSRQTVKKHLLNKNIKIKFNKKNKKINGIVIDSHLSHYLPRKYVDFCIITKCDIEEINKRLKIKKFHKNKIQENLQAEIFNVCYNEALEKKHKIIVVNTTKSINISSIAKELGG